MFLMFFILTSMFFTTMPKTKVPGLSTVTRT